MLPPTKTDQEGAVDAKPGPFRSLPSVTLLDPDPRSVKHIRAELKDVAFVAAAAFDTATRIDVSRFANASLVIVAVPSEDEASWKAVGDLVSSGLRVIAVGPSLSPEDVKGAERAGAHNYVVSTDVEGLRQAVKTQSAAWMAERSRRAEPDPG